MDASVGAGVCQDGVKSESHKTVLIALAANLLIGIAKLVAGVISGSAAMLAEAAHSVADTANQVFLLASLSFSERKPDENHPFGYGKERFLWSFMAAIFIFVSGALFSVYEGVTRLLHGGEKTSFPIAYAVLVLGICLEGLSLIRAARQTRDDAARQQRGVRRYVRTSRDPTTKTVLFEDSAAVTGLLIALVGLILSQVTGSHVFDALASILIGCLLAVIASLLWHDTRGLLIGEAALPEERDKLRAVLDECGGVDEVVEMLTMALGPTSLLVAAKLDLAADLDSDQIEQLAADLERSLRDAVPGVAYVFLDPTHRREKPVVSATS
jgi:cation diffusion facilitator family transporter